MKLRTIFFLSILVPFSLGIRAQVNVSDLPQEIDVNDAEITEMGHMTLRVKQEIVIDSLTMRVDTICKVDSIEWNTETGTAKKRMLVRRKANASGTDFYDKDTNWWWDMWWFSFNYPSLNAKGEPIILSSLVCMPDEDCSKVNNVIIGCHSTITANRECPTMNNHNGLFDTNDTDFFMLHSSSGWAVHASQSDMPYYNLVIIPDYEGYGLTKDVPHPYLSEEITARQVVDGVRYGIELYKTSDKVKKVRHSFRDGWRSICVGYSQGGGTSMAVHRFIEQNNLVDELQFAGSICGAGPYNPVTTIMYYMYHAKKGDKMSMAVVLPLILKGMCDSNPYMRNHSVSDYLSKPFLDTGILDWLSSKDYSTSDIKDEWDLLREMSSYYRDVVEEGGEAYMKKIMTPEGYAYFEKVLGDASTEVPANLYLDVTEILDLILDDFFIDDVVYAPDPERPAKRGVMEDLHLALAYNDLTKGWNPEHPLYMYHSYYDDVVPLVNRVSARNMFGEWVKRINPSVHLGHVATAIEFLAGTEEYDAVRKLAKGSVHPTALNLGSAEKIYKGTINKWIAEGEYTSVPAEYVLRRNASGAMVAILGSGYNACISQYSEGKFSVPATVEINGTEYPVGGVNDMAFRMCTKITHVTLPEGVTRVGDFAFFACRGLLEVDLPGTLRSIGTGAFIDLPNLQSVTLRGSTPPVWEYNDVFCFHPGGIGDTKTYDADKIIFYVADGHEDDYKQAFYSNEDLGWVTPEGWGTFRNIREIRDFVSEAYASFTAADSTLTFYYDGRRQTRIERGERTFDLNGKNPEITDQFPGWTDNIGPGSPTSSDDPEDHSKEIAHVVFSPSFYFVKPVTTAKWFSGCENLETIEGWENLNGSEVLSTTFMFSGCKNLHDDDIDLSNFVTPKCQYFLYMFAGCTGLTSIDLSNFDTSSAISMVSMFQNCSNLTSLDLSSFRTQNVTSFSSMFYNCSSLKSIAMERLYIRKYASVDGFFSGCSSLETLTLPIEVDNADLMFSGLINLKDLYYYGVEPFKSWSNRHNEFMPDQQTRFHVFPMSLNSWKEKWPNEESVDPYFYANVTYVGDLFTEENPMLIYTTSHWDRLIEFVDSGVTGIHAKLMADIKIETMIGSSSHPFAGSFDGNGHTLTFESDLAEDMIAPFRFIRNATIKNLLVKGHSLGKGRSGDLLSYRQIAGLVGWAGGNNLIKNVAVKEGVGSIYNGDSSNGGFIAHIDNGSTVIEGSVFAGTLAGLDSYIPEIGVDWHTTHWAGFVGWTAASATLRMTNCVFACDTISGSRTGCETFARASNSNSVSIDHCYYMQPISGTQGKKAYSVTSGTEGLELVFDGVTNTYDVSGIKAYETGISYNDVFYAGPSETTTLQFYAPGYDIDYSRLAVSGGAQLGTANMTNWTLSLANSNTVITLPITFTTIILPEDGTDNVALLEKYDGQTYDVLLEGRTFHKDGSWNMLSLPFDLSAEQIAFSPLAGSTITTLKAASLENGTLYFEFADTTAIDADKSYMVKWVNGVDINLSEIKDYKVEVKFNIKNLAAGIVFAAKDKDNYCMWQINTVSGQARFRPHVWTNGSWSLLDEKAISNINVHNGNQYTLLIEVIDGTTAKTYIDGQLIDTRNGNFPFGSFGFRQDKEDDGTPEEAYFDDFVVSSNGQVLLSEDFQNNRPIFAGGAVQDGQYYVVGPNNYNWTTVSDNNDISSPTFCKVTINRSLPAGIKFELDSISGAMAFKGAYNRTNLDSEEVVPLILDNGNRLFCADSDDVVGATSAYFELFDVPAFVTLIGDVNGDGEVNVSDVTALVSIILGTYVPTRAEGASDPDINGDSEVNVSDVTKLVNIILGREPTVSGFNSIDAGDTGLSFGEGSSASNSLGKGKVVLPLEQIEGKAVELRLPVFVDRKMSIKP